MLIRFVIFGLVEGFLCGVMFICIVVGVEVVNVLDSVYVSMVWLL